MSGEIFFGYFYAVYFQQRNGGIWLKEKDLLSFVHVSRPKKARNRKNFSFPVAN